jgi:putative membrane protein
MSFIIRLIATAVAIYIITRFFEGIAVDSFITALGVAILLAIVNAVIRPVLIFFTLPFTILSLGLFLLVINGAMLYLVAWFMDGFVIRSFLDAIIASVFISVSGYILNAILQPE